MYTAAALIALIGAASAAPAPLPTIPPNLSPYAPVAVICPSETLNRQANGINSAEAQYISSRQTKANASLSSWIKGVNSAFDTSTLPTLAFAASGGGFRAMLCAAGVIQGFDSRDSNLSTSGIFQGLSYISGLSGGSWFLSSFAANNWPTISNLQNTLWAPALEMSLLVPGGLDVALDDIQILTDIVAKEVAGFPPTIVDSWGRLLSYTLLEGFDGGVVDQWSGLTQLSNFTSYNVPFPIVTSLGVANGECDITNNSTQYEFNPYEFGSWDANVKAFTQTAYLGTSQSNGKPTSNICITNYDNTGFILGTSSNIFGETCSELSPGNDTLIGVLQFIVDEVKTPVDNGTYAWYPNPFYQSPASPYVEAQQTLYLVDGGIGGQNDPIWPFIQNGARDVSVLIVSDNSADTTGDLPNGEEIYATYQRAVQAGLTKMPTIPPTDTFLSQGLNTRATFFGCDEENAVTIVWLPNVPYTYPSGVSTFMLEYTPEQTAGMISNGNQIATQNGTAEWPTCLACAMQKKTGTTLPSECSGCFQKYCYSSSNSTSNSTSS